MCLYPRLIKNPKYKINQKNGGKVPVLDDKRKEFVPIGCQRCIECKKQKANSWKIRLIEDIKVNSNVTWVTLTFNDESLNKLGKEIEAEGYVKDNEIAKLAVKRFRERWRKKYKKSIRHWLITEIGGKRTERIHLHGFIWSENRKEIENKWGYGYVSFGKYVNNKTINYTVKYMHKNDIKHKEYDSIVLTSPGIGKNYLSESNIEHHKKYMVDHYNYKGNKLALPIYYRNQIFNEEEREKLWVKMIDKEERYVLGRKIDISKGEKQYYKILGEAQKKNKMLGYGTDEKNWNKIKYENEKRKLKYKELSNRVE